VRPDNGLVMPRGRIRLFSAALVGGLALAVLWGCASTLGTRGVAYDYFGSPEADDAWSRKIGTWQARERTERIEERSAAPAAVAGSGEGEAGGIAEASEDLRTKYESFRHDRKREMARELASWIQDQAKDHYRPDGPVDHWATLDETLETNGDDCDGLELLTLHLLRDFGFREDEVYRAIVYRKTDGQHHMVTLWFETEEDPWVIDPTGAMTSGMPRMSQVPEWVPLKIFTEDEDFTVRARVARR